MRASPARQPLAIDPAVLAELERSLSRHIGPLAKVLVKQGQGEAKDMDEFLELLAGNIPKEERGEFLAKATTIRKKAASAAPEAPAPSPAAPPAPVDAAQAAKATWDRSPRCSPGTPSPSRQP
jgi:serine/threonine-protein kinase